MTLKHKRNIIIHDKISFLQKYSKNCNVYKNSINVDINIVIDKVKNYVVF